LLDLGINSLMQRMLRLLQLLAALLTFRCKQTPDTSVSTINKSSVVSGYLRR